MNPKLAGKYLVTIAILFISEHVYTQTPSNLINNFSFEESNNNLNTRDTCERSFVYHRPLYWQVYDYVGCVVCTPDYISFNQDKLSYCYTCINKNQNPFQDDKHIFLYFNNPSKEYVLTTLNEKLQSGKKYKFRIQATGSPNEYFYGHLTKKGGADWQSSQNDNMMNFFSGTIPSTPIKEECKVKVYEQVVDVNKNDLNFLVLQVNGEKNTYQEFRLDRVELYEYCTESIIRTNREYRYEAELEEAKYISAGEIVNTTNTGNIQMLEGSITTFKGEKEITLVSGFNVNRGADFTAMIGRCGSSCPSSDVELTENYYLCSNSCINIGSHSIRGLTYEWSSLNPLNISLLSSVDKSSIIFCPGNTSSGTYIYTIKIRNKCGDITEKTIYVHYYPNAIPNPDFTVVNNNLLTNPIYPWIEIKPILNSEKVTVDVMDCEGNLLDTKTYLSGIEFSDGENIVWSLNTFLTPCNCYKIRIRSKNFCSQVIKEEILNWNRIKQPTNISLPTLSFCKDGKRWICVTGDGINKAEFIFFNRYGTEVSSVSHTFNSNPFCFEIPNANILPDGTYFMTTKIWGCDGTQVQYDRTSIFFPSCDNIDEVSNPSDNALNNLQTDPFDSVYAIISPNPLSYHNQIKYHVPQSGRIIIKVLNSNFENIFTVIDKKHDVGDYLVDFKNNNILEGVNYIYIELLTNYSYQKKVYRVIQPY
ncbi:MAG: hypothetical protein MUC81_04915 [Bacteroidia bacterium]|jgi:hypothetical protein|nr:hypothetical protein [Bacteroidia bacterium]